MPIETLVNLAIALVMLIVTTIHYPRWEDRIYDKWRSKSFTCPGYTPYKKDTPDPDKDKSST